MSATNQGSYKRDQVEQAVGITCGQIHAYAAKLPGRFSADLKRLLVQDRKLGETLPPRVPVRFAFQSGPAPGRGKDMVYSGYEAFALLTGVKLLRAGIPQGLAVAFMRGVRPPLETAHADMLSHEPGVLRHDLLEPELTQRLRDGILIEKSKQMLFLVTGGGDRAEARVTYTREGVERSANICNETELLEQLQGASIAHQYAVVVVELVNAAHQLHFHLDRTQPRTRGRS